MEEAIDLLLDTFLPCFKALQVAQPSLFVRLRLVRALFSDNNFGEFLDAAERLNKLRNKFAHHLEHPDIEHLTTEFVRQIERQGFPEEDFETEALPIRVARAISFICGMLVGFRGGYISGQRAFMRSLIDQISTHRAGSRMNMPVRIERIRPRPGSDEYPVFTERGYELVDCRITGQKNKVENSTFVRSLEEAAYLVEQGFAIRMGGPGKRPSLISPKSLRIVRT